MIEDIDKLFDEVTAQRTFFLVTDLDDFAVVNEVMARHINEPYPARAAIGVRALPRGAAVEIEAIMVPPATTDSGGG